MPETDELTAAFSRLRKAISQRTKMATMFGYGPRYLHSTGQLHKGGPANGRLLVVTSDDASDIAVQDAAYTLGELSRAQAAADVAVMRERGRLASRAIVSGDYATTVDAVAAAIGDDEG